MEKETEVSAGARADDGEVDKDKEEGNMEVDQKDKEEAEVEGGKEDTKEGGKDKEKDAQEGEGEEEEDAFLSPLDMLQVDIAEGDKSTEANGGEGEGEGGDPNPADLLSSLLSEASKDPYSVLEGHDDPGKEEEKKKTNGDKSGDGDIEIKEEALPGVGTKREIKRPRAFGDDDDAEDWIPAKEKAAKRRREVMEAAMREAREKAMTNDQRIIRENLSKPFPRYSKETQLRLASECALFKPKLELQDVASSNNSSVKKYLSTARRRQVIRQAAQRQAAQAEQRQRQQRGVQEGIRRTYVRPKKTPTDYSPFGLPSQAPPPPLPRAPAAPVAVNRTVQKPAPVAYPPRKVKAAARAAAAKKTLPEKKDLVDTKSHVKVNAKALDDLMVRLKQQQEENDLLRGIIRESFSSRDLLEEEEEIAASASVEATATASDDNNKEREKPGDAAPSKKKPELDLGAILPHLQRPEYMSGTSFYGPRGLRMIDVGLLKLALEKAQLCPCSKAQGCRIELHEVSPHRVHEDLSTHLSLTCSVCKKATVFPTSSFCESYPSNYIVNKELLDLLGPESFFKLAKYVQASSRDAKEELRRFPGFPYQLLLSIVNNTPQENVPAAAPPPPIAPLPIRPSPPIAMPSSAVSVNRGVSHAMAPPRPTPSSLLRVRAVSTMQAPRPPAPLSHQQRFNNVPRPAPMTLPARLPLPPGLPAAPPPPQPPPPPRPIVPSLPPAPPSMASLLRPVAAPSAVLPTAGAIVSQPVLQPVQAPSVRPTLQPSEISVVANADLPLGAKVQVLAPGTPIVTGAEVRRRTTAQVKLPKGTYKISTGSSMYYVSVEDPVAVTLNGGSSPSPAASAAATVAPIPKEERMVRVMSKAMDGSFRTTLVPASKVNDRKFIEEQSRLQHSSSAVAAAAAATLAQKKDPVTVNLGDDREMEEEGVDPLAV